MRFRNPVLNVLTYQQSIKKVIERVTNPFQLPSSPIINQPPCPPRTDSLKCGKTIIFHDYNPCLKTSKSKKRIVNSTPVNRNKTAPCQALDWPAMPTVRHLMVRVNPIQAIRMSLIGVIVFPKTRSKSRPHPFWPLCWMRRSF